MHEKNIVDRWSCVNFLFVVQTSFFIVFSDHGDNDDDNNVKVSVCSPTDHFRIDVYILCTQKKRKMFLWSVKVKIDNR